MIFEFLFLGKTKDSNLDKGIVEYVSRLKHYTSVSVKLLKVKPQKNSNDRQIQEYEGGILLKNASSGSLKIALDSKGKQYTSEEFASLITKWQQRGLSKVSIMVGGPLGLSANVIKESDELLSLSKMTFTHDMVRLFLLEQIYRAFTIKAGEKYHK